MELSLPTKYLNGTWLRRRDYFTLIGKMKIRLESRLNILILIGEISLNQHITGNRIRLCLPGENVKPTSWHSFKTSFRFYWFYFVVKCHQRRAPIDH